MIGQFAQNRGSLFSKCRRQARIPCNVRPTPWLKLVTGREAQRVIPNNWDPRSNDVAGYRESAAPAKAKQRGSCDPGTETGRTPHVATGLTFSCLEFTEGRFIILRTSSTDRYP